MDNRKIVTTGKITRDFIAGFLVLGIIFSIISTLLVAFISRGIENQTILMCVNILSNLILTLAVCYFSIKSTFKKNTIYKSNVNKLMKNIIIFFVIVLLITISYNNNII